MWDEVEFLVDDADPEIAGMSRTSNLGFHAIDEDLTGVLLVSSAQNLHQCGLPGTILAEKYVNLSAGNRQVHLIERNDSRERFANPAHLECEWLPADLGLSHQ
jgi:hypothetical protein